MTKHSRYEQAQRAAETTRMREIEAAWTASIPSDTLTAFKKEVEVARARPRAERRPDMAPGTLPNPPRPGREPRPPKAEPRGRGGR